MGSARAGESVFPMRTRGRLSPKGIGVPGAFGPSRKGKETWQVGMGSARAGESVFPMRIRRRLSPKGNGAQRTFLERGGRWGSRTPPPQRSEASVEASVEASAGEQSGAAVRLSKVGGRTTGVAAAWRAVVGLGELTLLFAAALRGSFRRPFYWRELLEQCRFILTANFVPLFLTGLGFGTIVALEAGHFFRSASAEYRLGGFTVMSNIREFSPVATGLMIAAVSGTAIVADLGARQVRSELEALSVMGLSNVLFIVVPRALALMLMTALYNSPMIVFTMLASYVVGVVVVGVNAGAFM